MPLERKTPVAYPDGVYEIAGQDRPNVLLIANVTQNGLTGFGSSERTGLFIFFGEFGKSVLLTWFVILLLWFFRSTSCGRNVGCPEARLYSRV